MVGVKRRIPMNGIMFKFVYLIKKKFVFILKFFVLLNKPDARGVVQLDLKPQKFRKIQFCSEKNLSCSQGDFLGPTFHDANPFLDLVSADFQIQSQLSNQRGSRILWVLILNANNNF